jgi:hypothetical protein
MKELTNAQQEKVIKFFLAGDTYDEIVIKTGTSKKINIKNGNLTCDQLVENLSWELHHLDSP